MYFGLNKKHINDKYSNPLIYFAIVNTNKYALIYLLLDIKYNINENYYNKTSCLREI